MKKLTIFAIIILGFNLGLSGTIHNNMVPRDLPEDVSQEVGQRADTSQYTRPVSTTLGRTGPRTLAVGESVTVKLASNRTTRYSWRVSCTPGGMLDTPPSVYEKGESNGMMGVGGTELFTLTAKQAGNVSCTFEYGRPWDEDSYNNDKKETHFFVITE